MPKPRDAGLEFKYWFATPLPETPTQKKVAELPLVNLTDSLCQPVVVGVNTKLKVTLCPGLSVSGRVKPLTLNAGRLEFTAAMVTPADPALLRVMG
ncbi:MAG TPA: hypothetical protein VMU61_02000 [Candidatus Aquilonibacter sp.]|nr:hypothetical protein [Candidatus Aquilonibacter sp.]